MEAGEYQKLDRLETDMWWYRGLHRQMAQALTRHLPQAPAGPVLDAGCGTGGLLRHLSDLIGHRTMVGVEINPEAASRAAGKSGAAICVGSVNSLPFAAASIAAVLSADVLCHARVDPQLAIAEMARVLRPGGLAIFNLPAYDWLRSAHDRQVHNARRFTRGSLRPLLVMAGLRTLQSTYWNSFLLPAMVARRMLSRSEAGKSDVMEYPAALNALFGAVLAVERGLVGAGLSLPAGGSLLVVARKDV